MALLRSAGHGAPPCQAPSSLAPQRLPSTHPVNSSTYPGPVLPLSTLFSTILHYIPRGQGSIITRLSCSFLSLFLFSCQETSGVHEDTQCLLPYSVESVSPSQPGMRPPSFSVFSSSLLPYTVLPYTYSSHQFRHLISQPAKYLPIYTTQSHTHPSILPSVHPCILP